MQLYSATEAHGPTFRQFEEGTADRIRYERVNQRTGDKVEYSDVVKGADIGGGNHVMLDQGELDSVAPGRSRSLDIHTFADLDEIDPLYFNKTYFLGPGGEEATKPYTLLRDALGDSGKAAIASFVMRSREYLAAVRADGDLLVLETLFFADEVRDPSDYRDTYADTVNDLVHAKKHEKEFQPAAGASRTAGKTGGKKTPAKRTAVKRPNRKGAA